MVYGLFSSHSPVFLSLDKGMSSYPMVPWFCLSDAGRNKVDQDNDLTCRH